MAQTEPFCPSHRTDTALSRIAAIRSRLREAGLWADASTPTIERHGSPAPANNTWRISPCPLLISRRQLDFFTALGPQLLSFYRALQNVQFPLGSQCNPEPIDGAADTQTAQNNTTTHPTGLSAGADGINDAYQVRASDAGVQPPNKVAGGPHRVGDTVVVHNGITCPGTR